MIIRQESPFRMIPVALDRRQAYFIEGIRVSVEMIELAHTRLQETLLRITAKHQEDGRLDQTLLTTATLDAWSVIDCFHRLVELFQQAPGMAHRNRVPSIRNLFAANDTVNELRNSVQHLPGQIQGMQNVPQWSLWGALGWCVPPEGEDGDILTCTYAVGIARPGNERPFVNPLGKAVRRPVGLITLSQHPHSVCVSDLMGVVEAFTRDMEAALTQTFNGNAQLAERHGSDFYVALTLR